MYRNELLSCELLRTEIYKNKIKYIIQTGSILIEEFLM